MITLDCPTCRKVLRVPTREQAPYRPFCSRRCQLIDLNKWLNMEYTISRPASADDLAACDLEQGPSPEPHQPPDPNQPPAAEHPDSP